MLEQLGLTAIPMSTPTVFVNETEADSSMATRAPSTPCHISRLGAKLMIADEAFACKQTAERTGRQESSCEFIPGSPLQRAGVSDSLACKNHHL